MKDPPKTGGSFIYYKKADVRVILKVKVLRKNYDRWEMVKGIDFDAEAGEVFGWE